MFVALLIFVVLSVSACDDAFEMILGPESPYQPVEEALAQEVDNDLIEVAEGEKIIIDSIVQALEICEFYYVATNPKGIVITANCLRHGNYGSSSFLLQRNGSISLANKKLILREIDYEKRVAIFKLVSIETKGE